MSVDPPQSQETKAAWQPLSPLERRVAGVLVEKAKTTPDNYPMSLNAVRVACNQKTNRFPVMDVEEDAVLDALESLRAKGAVAEVQGAGRVPKYRHYLKQWLNVDGAELAVMAELLLRGPQTVGDLRGRAARMTPLPDLAALQKLLDALEARRLIVPLTPRGRGQIVTHNLYPPQELERVMAEYGSSPAATLAAAGNVAGRSAGSPAGSAPPAPAATAPAPPSPAAMAPVAPGPAATAPVVPPASAAAPVPRAAEPPRAPSAPVGGEVAQFRAELEALQEEIRRLRDELQSTADELRASIDVLLRFKRDLEG